MKRISILHITILFILLRTASVLTSCSGGGDGGSSFSPSPSGTATVSGTITYEDKIYGSSGFITTGTPTYKAVRYGIVEIVDASTSKVLASAVTGTDGSYFMTFFYYGKVVYPRVVSEATIPNAQPIMVKNLSSSLYAQAGTDISLANQGTFSGQNISIPANSIGGAFNILDVLTNGFQFVNGLANAYPPSLSAYWHTGNNLGTYYCNGYDPYQCINGEGIYVLNYAGDTDEYDDDVLYHEFGHFTAAHFSQDDSPGGQHALGQNDLDLRLAWSEGWGDSMPGHIKMWLNATAPQQLSSATGVPLTEYIDTKGAGAQIAIDMDNPGGPPYVYACDEVAVAKILLDLNISFGMQSIWDVVTSAAFTATSPVNLEAFWDAWISLGKTISEPVPTIFGSRSIYYMLDSFETDSQFVSASTYTGIPQNHTLYGDVNLDYVLFSASTGSQYTITTSGLTNGADTYLTLYNNTFNNILANDNASGITYISGSNYDYYDVSGNYVYPHNNATTLSSSLGFTSAATGTFYVEIKSSPNRPKSAGKYGSYTLTITSP